jgi:hypothetical protein
MWEGNDGEFRIIDPEEVARKWGQRRAQNWHKIDSMLSSHGNRFRYASLTTET